jgi:2-methylcitrate dehydratase PrpD
MTTLARQLVRRLRSIADSELSESVAHAARLHLTDAIGVGLAASRSTAGRAYRTLTGRVARGGPCSIFGSTQGASAVDAALVNGGLIHSLEFDDTHTGSIMHGSAVTAAAALAAGQSLGTSGTAMLKAYVHGWEVLARIGLAAPGRFHAAGFQATSVAGTLASALVCAELMGLDEDRSVHALGIALSQSSGVMEFLSNGSSVKSLNPGWAAHGGVYAALLAESGMTGPETSLDGRWGLFAQFSDAADGVERLASAITDLGERWYLPDAALKFQPCCHYLHPFIEAAGLLIDQGVDPERVTEIVCEVPIGAAPVICEPWSRALAPETGHAARWSLPITVAARLLEGRVDLATFETLASGPVRALASKTRWVALADARFPQQFEAVIHCTMDDGKRYSARVDDVDGNPSRPPATDRVLAKFRDNAARALPADAVRALESACMNVDQGADLAELGRALRAVGT